MALSLESQLCSLELAKRLKELNVPQESAFDWYCQVGGIICDTDVRGKWIIRPASERDQGFGERCSAFTVAELGEMLPMGFHSECVGGSVGSAGFKKDKFFCGGYLKEIKHGKTCVHADTEADARAKCLIHLIEQGIVKFGKEGAK